MEYALVRTSKNQIKGPFAKEKVCQMILDHQIFASDEICLGNSYWIPIHERNEIKQALGIDVPLESFSPDQEEITLVKEFVFDEPTKPNFSGSISNPNQESNDSSVDVKTAILTESQLREIRSYRNHSSQSFEDFERKAKSRAIIKSGLVFGGALLLILLFYYLSTFNS